MKKQLFGLMTILTVIGACQKNEVPVSLPEEVTIHATIEEKDATKTIMDENNNILWSENDQIIAFMKSSYGHKYQVKPSFVGKSYADFSVVSSGNGSDLSAGNAWDHNIVYYPFSENIECLKLGSNYALEVNLPSEQVYVPDSFANGSMAMVAVSENNNITFKNVLGGIKLQLKGTQKVASIKIEGKNNEKLSGSATITAYTDETKPAITMVSSASTSVTLNCGEGVQLNESKATEFIISLPPVLFSKGLTVTVTDAEGKTYTVETNKSNTVLRSSILAMPAFKLGETPESGSPENAVDMIVFDLSRLTVVPGATHSLTVDFEPYDAKDKTLVWNSSNPSVVSVNASGEIKALADGTSTITAVAIGGATATCAVTVISCTAIPSVDYIADGVNYGKGIAIGDVVWAPVNCGYEAPTDTYKGYPYGKLYQWGRKYGQGYNSYDASYPSSDNLVEGPVMPSVAQAEENKDKFYYNSKAPNDWSKVQKDDLWNSGTESSPVKTKYDPCPEGWRVPTVTELGQLLRNGSCGTYKSQNGYYSSGEYSLIDGNPQIFLPAAGSLYHDGTADGRDTFGRYWSSRPSGYNAYRTCFSYIYVGWYSTDHRAYGSPVRCVQE